MFESFFVHTMQVIGHQNCFKIYYFVFYRGKKFVKVWNDKWINENINFGMSYTFKYVSLLISVSYMVIYIWLWLYGRMEDLLTLCFFQYQMASFSPCLKGLGLCTFLWCHQPISISEESAIWHSQLRIEASDLCHVAHP